MVVLRQQVASLEAEFTNLLSVSTTTISEEPFDPEQRLAPEQLLQQYSAITQIKCALLIEKEALFESNAKFAKLCQRLQILLQENAAVSPFYFQSLSVAEYERVVDKVRAQVLHFLAQQAEKPSALMNMMDWTVSRHVDHGVLRFALKKTFTALSAQELLKRSWAILSSPTKYTQLYSPSVRAELYLLQHVDDNTLLYYTELESAGEKTTAVRSVYLLRREPFANGYLILVCSVDPKRLHFDEDGINDIIDGVRREARHGPRCLHIDDAAIDEMIDQVHRFERGEPAPAQVCTSPSNEPRWAEMCAWMVFEHRAERRNESTFQWCGSSLHSWGLEVQMIAMRWQTLVVGYDLLLQDTTE